MNRIPLVLLTGFLGAGKTTMLNGLLATEAFRDTAVVINEAGDVGLDHLLVERGTDSVTLLDGGCVCCRAKGSLAPALGDLLRGTRDGRVPPFKRVVVETSGLSDPAVVLEELIADVFFNRRYALAGVVTLVDSRAFAASAADHAEARMQVTLADRLLLTKADLASEDDLAAARRLLAELNPQAPQIVVAPGTATMATFWPDRLDLARSAAPMAQPAASAIATASSVFPGVIAADLLDHWLDHTIGLLGPMLLRMKAMLDLEGAAGPTVLHGVRGLVHQPMDLQDWPNGDRRNRIVLIGRDVEQQILADALDRLAAAVRRGTSGAA